MLHTYKNMRSNTSVHLHQTSLSLLLLLKLFTGMQDMTEKVKSNVFSYHVIFIPATG